MKYDDVTGRELIDLSCDMYLSKNAIEIRVVADWENDATIAEQYMGYVRRPHTRIVNGKAYDVGAWYENGQYVFDCHSPFPCADRNQEFSPTTNWNHTKLLIDKFIAKTRCVLNIRTGSDPISLSNYLIIRFFENKSEFVHDYFSLDLFDETYSHTSRELLYCQVIANYWDCYLQDIVYDGPEPDGD